MNEKLKTIMLKSGTHKNISAECQHRIELIAELIVKECIRYFNEDYTRNFDTLWREDLSKGIKEHFGVE